MSKVLAPPGFEIENDEPKPVVTVKLDYGPPDGFVVENEHPDKNAVWSGIQRAKYPTAEEAGTGGPGDVAPGGPRPFSLTHAAGTMLSDLAAPLKLLQNEEGDPSIVRGYGGLQTLLRGAYHMNRDLGAARGHSEDEAGRAWAEGDYPAAMTRGLLNMVPVAGPMIANMAEEAGRDTSAGVGHVAAAVVAPKVYGAAGRFANEPIAGLKSILKAPAALRDAAVDLTNNAKGVTPELGVFKAIRPRNFIRNADKRIAGALPEINAGAELTGKPVTGVGPMAEAIDAQIGARLKQQTALIGGEEFAIPGKPVADAIMKSIPKLERLRMGEEGLALLRASVDSVWDRNFTPQELGELIKDSNASTDVSNYFQKLPGQQLQLGRRLNSAMSMAENQGIRQTLLDGLDNYKGTGQGVKAVNGALRDLISTKDLLDRRYNVDLRQSIQNLPQQASKLLAFGRFGKAARIIASGGAGAGTEALTGLGEMGLANFLRELNSTDGQIASAFRRFNGQPDPVPINPVGRYNRALGPATSTVQPQSLTGSASPGSTSAQYQWQNQAAEELPRQDISNLPRDPQTDWRTTFSRWFGRPQENAPSAVTSAGMLQLKKFLDQERAAGRLGLQTTRQAAAPGEPDVIDVPYTTRSGDPIEQPASPLPETRQIGTGSGQQPGRVAIPMPESPLTTGDLVNPAKSEIVRDPKTGRFKKVYTSENTTRPNILNSEKGAVPIGGDDDILWDELKSTTSNKTLADILKLSGIESSEEDAQMNNNSGVIRKNSNIGYDLPDGFSVKKTNTGYGIDGPGLKKGENWVGFDHETPEDAVANYFSNYTTKTEKMMVIRLAEKLGWDYDIDLDSMKTAPEKYSQKLTRSQEREWEFMSQAADEALGFLQNRKK